MNLRTNHWEIKFASKWKVKIILCEVSETQKNK